MIIYRKPIEIFTEFAKIYSGITGLSEDIVTQSVKDIKSYYKTGENKSLSFQQKEKWYSSLKDGNPDYSLYDTDDYVLDTYFCFEKYSRRYIKELTKGRNFEDNIPFLTTIKQSTHSIVDVGCGIGYSTAAFKELLPDHDVYGFNLSNTTQYKICEKVADKYNFNLTGSLEKIGNIDTIFASEYFEHFEKPIEHLKEIVNITNPKYFIIANSFNTTSIGHFITYKHNGKEIDQFKISRLFNENVLACGYKKVKSKIFNSKPNIFVKIE
jgi:SAM-dependent methyltransferase